MRDRTAWICRACWAVEAKSSTRTLAGPFEAAKRHGCIQFSAPTTRTAKMALVRIQTPTLQSEDKWRAVWDSLDVRSESAPICRSALESCGHTEGSHQFSTLTQPRCDLNCSRCA